MIYTPQLLTPCLIHVAVMVCLLFQGCGWYIDPEMARRDRDAVRTSEAFGEALGYAAQQDYNTGEAKMRAAMRLIEEVDGKPATYNIYAALAYILVARGRYTEALEIYTQLFADPPLTPILGEKCGDQADWALFTAQYGDYAKAKDMFPDSCGAERWFFDNVRKYVIQIGSWNDALKLSLLRVDDSRRHGLVRPDHLGSDLTGLGTVYFYTQNYSEAQNVLNEAMEINLGSAWPWPDYFAECAMILARTQAKTGNTSETVRNLRNAIKMTGKQQAYRSELARAKRLLAYHYLAVEDLYHAGDFMEQSNQLYHDMGRDGHPDAADVLKGLSDVAVKRNQLTSATTYCERALGVFDGSILSDHPRITPTLVALAALDTLTSQSAERIEARFTRIEACHKKPLGMWREDLSDTLALYTPLLRASGHAATAERLEHYLPPPPELTVTIPDGLTREVGPPPQFIER